MNEKTKEETKEKEKRRKLPLVRHWTLPGSPNHNETVLKRFCQHNHYYWSLLYSAIIILRSRADLLRLTCFSACWVIKVFPESTPNSDMGYRIFNARRIRRDLFACVCTQGDFGLVSYSKDLN